MRAQDYATDGRALLWTPVGTVCCCWKEVIAGHNPITPECRPWPLCCSSGAWPACVYVEGVWGVEADLCLAINTTVSLWSPLAQSPSLGSNDLSLLCVSLCQTQRNTVVSGRTFSLPSPSPWQTRTFFLIYYLGTVIISKVLSHQYHFPHHPIGFTGDDGEWKHQCKCSPKMINLFRGKIV